MFISVVFDDAKSRTLTYTHAFSSAPVGKRITLRARTHFQFSVNDSLDVNNQGVLIAIDVEIVLIETERILNLTRNLE